MGTACSAACCRCSRRHSAAGAAAGEAAGPDRDDRNHDLEEPVQLWESPVQTSIHWPEPAVREVSLAPALPQSARRNIDIVSAAPTGEDCVICLGKIEEECARTSCGHHFHKECIEKYLVMNNKKQLFHDRFPFVARCPICRASLLVPLPVEATASSGRQIEVVEVPPVGAFCHLDRHYTFRSLGGFQRPGMFYVLTCNEDRKTFSSKVMWTLTASRNVAVHLNFRSDGHVVRTGSWLQKQGWKRNTSLQSTVSSGIPNGPYSGPVFSRCFPPGKIELMGSNTWEGVYFVFVEALDTPTAGLQSGRGENAADLVQTDISLSTQALGNTSPGESTVLGTPTEVSDGMEEDVGTL
mmetsp:Transcript_36067/g.64783  ORF Transcript_36067/g.64783 Transcript_36067/m.64783 type:complete len:353 (-) Transcript_36067:67-1125(-)